MKPSIVSWAGLLSLAFSGFLVHATEKKPATLKLTGHWQVQVTASAPASGGTDKEVTVTIDVPPPTLVTVRAEKYDRLPLFNPRAGGGWRKGAALRGLKAQECTSRGLLDPASLQVRAGATADSMRFEPGQDFSADLDWATFGRLPEGRIREDQPVFVDYRHGLLRLDSIVLTPGGRMEVRQGKPHAAAPLPPALADGERRLANLWLPGHISKLGQEHLFPILETAYPEPPTPGPSPAEKRLPRSLQKLREGKALRLLAWGDSVTDGGYLPRHERWQDQFAVRLQKQYPKAKIELVTEAWGGRSTASYLAEPPGSPHNYKEKVLGARPDLIVSEFVNDAGLTPRQVEERYSRFLADFTGIQAEWIILTPHYVRPDWMGLASQRDIDNDPRPYVAGLRQFAQKHPVALADASLRWGRLWRQGIPYNTLNLNSINHPDARGMKLFVDSLMALFPDSERSAR